MSIADEKSPGNHRFPGLLHFALLRLLSSPLNELDELDDRND